MMITQAHTQNPCPTHFSTVENSEKEKIAKIAASWP
jgi:hypothetical protein